jgi:SpoVK/Ycf46/Vps4 family AAA+-type ATPase
MKSFNENWDGVKRKQMEEVERIAEVMNPQEKAKQDAINARIRKLNTDIAVDQIKEILRSYTHDKKQREMILAAIKQIKEEAAEKAAAGAQSLTEEVLAMKHFTEMGDLAKDIMAYAKDLKGGKKNLGGFTPEQATLYQIAGTLHQAHHQQQDFLKGLIHSLEGVQMRDKVSELSNIIRELRKYKK